MSDINGHVADTPNEFVSLPVGDFAVLTDLRSRVAYTLAQYNASHEDTKSKKKAYDAARDQFEKEFDRIVAKTNGPDLPLFQNQTDAIAAAEHDPVARELLDRLIGAGHTNLNLLVVFGYTEEERNQARAYLDARDAFAAARERGELAETTTVDVEVPAFLLADPADRDVDAADDLSSELLEQGLEISPRRLLAFSEEQRREIKGWLDTVIAVKAEKGEALTMDDLPAAPGFLLSVPDDGESEPIGSGASVEA